MSLKSEPQKFQVSSESLATSTGSFTVHGIPYSSLTSSQYMCLECGLKLNKVLAYAHSYKHLQQRTRKLAPQPFPSTPIGARKKLMVAAKSPAPAMPATPLEPVLKTHFVATLAVLPQKRKPSCLEALQQCRLVQQHLHRLVQHLNRLIFTVERPAFRQLRLHK